MCPAGDGIERWYLIPNPGLYLDLNVTLTRTLTLPLDHAAVRHVSSWREDRSLDETPQIPEWQPWHVLAGTADSSSLAHVAILYLQLYDIHKFSAHIQMLRSAVLL